MRFYALFEGLIMSYTYNGAKFIVSSPVHSISVNKLNVAVTDKKGTQLISFRNKLDSKQFLTWLYQA